MSTVTPPEAATPPASASASAWPHYRTVWRWHFYAGLYCIPFVLILATTGTIYLFKPQVETWLERPYDHLSLAGTPATAAAQAQAALAAFPDSAFQAYELPPAPHAAVRILIRDQGLSRRVYVHPESCAILGSVLEEDRLMRVVRRIHGTLLIGERGSWLVELAACWTIVMILTGLFLWWPRNATTWGGIVYPRWKNGSRIFLKDLHSVIGVWTSALALFLIVSGLPWANVWGNYFRNVRSVAGAMSAKQDWTLGGQPEPNAGSADHAQHQPARPGGGRGGRSGGGGSRFRKPAVSLTSEQWDQLNQVTVRATEFSLPVPTQVAPVSGKPEVWSVQTMTQNRPLREEIELDGTTLAVVSRSGFGDRPILDQMVSVGIAAHEGQLFGPLNQLLGVVATSGLVLLSLSGLLMWWRRRTPGVLGAPPSPQTHRWAIGLIVLIGCLALALPMFGISLILVLILERTALRAFGKVHQWLGLSRATAGA